MFERRVLTYDKGLAYDFCNGLGWTWAERGEAMGRMETDELVAAVRKLVDETEEEVLHLGIRLERLRRLLDDQGEKEVR